MDTDWVFASLALVRYCPIGFINSFIEKADAPYICGNLLFMLRHRCSCKHMTHVVWDSVYKFSLFLLYDSIKVALCDRQ